MVRRCSEMWAATRHQVLKGYKTETLSGNLILAWFISWFQEVRNSNAGTNAREVSLGFYLAVLTRSWLVIQLSAELVRCSLSARQDVGTSARGRYAFLICLWGSSKDYVLGALVLGFSIKRTRTKHSLVCLHTEDVSPEHVKLLQIFWDCRVVEHIEVAAAKRLSTDDRVEESRFSKVFTKLRALQQVDFEKVLVMDIDLLVLSSVDKLFDIPAPAALKRGMNCGKWPYKHGDDIDGTTFFSGCKPDKTHSWGQGTGINAGVMLLAPNMADFHQMQAELREPWHPGHVRGNGPEQDYLSRFYADRPWRHISVEHNFQVHHMYNALDPRLTDAERLVVCQNYQTVRIVHFSGNAGVKPWTRCLQKGFGWPSRDQDEEYMQSFLSDYHSYLLWVKKDPERWNKMERNMFDESSLRGFSLGQDGAIYFEDESGKDPMKPAHVCALLGGALHLGWVTVLKLVVFVGLLVLAVQRDVLSENPFWLLAALFVGVAFWQRTLATGWYFLAKCLLLRCRCCRCIWEAPIHGGQAGMEWPILAQRYDLVIFVLLLQIAAQASYRLLETLGFLLFAAVLNAAYSPAAGLGVLVMAIVLQCFMARTELRAYRTMRAEPWEQGRRIDWVTLGLHCSLVVIVAICMWSMEGGSHWSGHRKAPAENAIGGSVEEYPFCHLKWPLGKEGKQEMSLIDFADMCALTNLPSSDFNSSLESRFPGWSLLYERRGGESHSYGYNDWTTFFELADPSNETTIFAVRGTQSPLDVMQDLSLDPGEMLWEENPATLLQNIFTPVAVTQIAAYFGPDLTSSVTKTVFALFSGLPTIDKDFFQVLLEHVKNRVKGSPDRRFYLTGHSLGGGLAKLVALEVGQKSVTFAAPGLRYTSQMLLSDTAFSKDQLLASGDRLGTVVVPEHDLVSRVDQQLGAQLGIACDKNLFGCHSLQHIIFELHQGCKSFA
eukprot:g33281.t1